MAVEVQTVDPAIKTILEILQSPLWSRPDFVISTIVGLAGVALSWAAFREARAAKKAATVAGRTVKIQTIVIELTEISQQLDKLEPDITYERARDLITGVSRKLRRLIAPFSDDPDLSNQIAALRAALDSATTGLNSVKPTADVTKETEVPRAVYYGIEFPLRELNNAVAEVLGRMERSSMNIGRTDGHP